MANFQEIWENGILARENVNAQSLGPDEAFCSEDRKQPTVGGADKQEGEW